MPVQNELNLTEQLSAVEHNQITDIIGKLPYRMAFAGGWIDQPFISAHNPTPPGAMVVVSLEPSIRFMDRCGMGTSTRDVARQLWGDQIPAGNPALLVRQLYQAENLGKAQPSGSQDMAGLIYPGINRLDYDFNYEGGIFPVHVESCQDPQIAQWLEKVVSMIPVNQRPEGYDPLSIKNPEPEWVRRLGQSGKDCYSAILARDLKGLGESMNECMRCWEVLLPYTVRHHSLNLDLVEILEVYQARYAGAMYSGCGGGYLYVVSDEPVLGAIRVKVHVAETVVDA
jgi:hypothetical protein